MENTMLIYDQNAKNEETVERFNKMLEEEAIKLGLEQHKYYKAVCDYEKTENRDLGITPLFKFFLAYWADTHNEILETTIKDYEANGNTWTI